MISLSENNALPLYQQLYRQLKKEIQTGNLTTGQKLPSKRKLAEQLHVSINTIDSAYTQLEAEGFILSSPRRGFYVQETGSLPQAFILPDVPVSVEDMTTQSPYTVDFSPFGMAHQQFPYGVWRRLMKNCFNEYNPQLLQRTPPQGDWGLRAAVADYLYRARGVVCTPDQIVMGAGTDHLLSILAYILPNSYSLAVENPLYNRAHILFQRYGHKITTVPVNVDGLSLAHLPKAENVLLYTTPSHQYPLGYAMPIGQRTALLRWSGDAAHRYIIEDDYDSEFRYTSRPIPALQSIDKMGRVIYLGTFSRSVAPALRISYMVLPQELLALYRKQYQGYASAVSGFEQILLREFMMSGSFETHVNRMRIYYKARRQCLVDAMASINEIADILGEPAGHHLTIRISNGMSESALVKTAEKSGVRVYPISPYFIGPIPTIYHSTIMLGFGGLNDHEIQHGLTLLHKAWISS